MLHTMALISGLASLALIFAMVYAVLHSRDDSWLRRDAVLLTLPAVLVGLFTMAAAQGIKGLLSLFERTLTLDAVLAAAADLVGLAAALLTIVVFVVLAIAVRRRERGSNNVTPLTPRPVAPNVSRQTLKKAA